MAEVTQEDRFIYYTCELIKKCSKCSKSKRTACMKIKARIRENNVRKAQQ
jgi:hypothetical protein